MRTLSAFTSLVIFFAASVVSAQVGNNIQVLNPNLAKENEIASLPGMEQSLVAQIISARPFASSGQLDTLLAKSLNASQLTTLHEKLFVPINLNTASSEEIMNIPQMTRRMAHEFDEYRPYKSMEQFRREIGKYVDEAEVARLEQFVFVPMDLNTASSEALATIPGMSQRMVHEFEEYRPYQSIEQFRREIGKYVDEKEVARLERYVVIP